MGQLAPPPAEPQLTKPRITPENPILQCSSHMKLLIRGASVPGAPGTRLSLGSAAKGAASFNMKRDMTFINSVMGGRVVSVKDSSPSPSCSA